MNTHNAGLRQFAPVGGERAGVRISYSSIVYGLFFFFMWYSYVNGWPYSGRSAAEFEDALSTSTKGDSARQAFFLLMFGLTILFTLANLKAILFRAFQPMLFVLFAWILLSCLWAIDPVTSFKRSVLAIIVAVITINMTAYLGPEKIMDILYKSLISLLIVNFLSVALVPNWAIHLSDEYDEGLIGAWKGIMIHKNVASGVSSVSAIIFFFKFYTRHRLHDLVLTVLAIVFLMGTSGKTSIGFLLPSIAFALAYRWMMLSNHKNKLLLTTLLSIVAVLMIGYGIFRDEIIEVFSNPQSFTGRVAIWNAIIAYGKDHFWLGSGYGSFWQIGEKSPIFWMNIQQMWLTGVAHSHNGFLEMWVTTGIIGLVLSLISGLVMPIIGLFYASREDANIASLYAGIWLFCLLTNLLETRFLTKDSVMWTIMLLSMTSLHIIGGRRRSGNRVYD
ncbi:O-antigen ligase family protein [Rhizobiaceae bacterium BDR2-2]|uniref:O-antigen ligase family protein n=1 Tax=Ectorhizobium quercum TaxID=2965071 RepID=A0AAE3N0X5_9HYPH|nr:O-antigen ligase family protein [Ectorhizobium quercum]MCX8998126.1 O-antigen ligase family protein [Ectorhizobium quercum]